ncbi:TonB-dependent receptor [Rhodoblastus sp.]|jgi:catecholate siderophore receptor|uniref:TonB-dependent receptor domain-containing protein n=1 Tax=Rhodoblastus sp. TaxID=1962975 RepID=UPI0025F6CDD7|nr:TonB-dependent receptor [Rhodoblastus sp.]
MNDLRAVRAPISLRSFSKGWKRDSDVSGKVSLACLIGAATIGGADAQEQSSTLPAVTVDAPIVRKRPPAAKPTPAQLRVRAAVRRVSRQAPKATPSAPSQAAGGSAPIFTQLADGDPYADPAAPYKANRLASARFSEPIADLPRSVTVLTRQAIDDKNATSLKELARTTAGVTLGSGEGGNAFGDRFFIRGFDARNDVFVDGVRDPGVSIRENFFTEQVEILRGPGSSFAGRGTTGGAINIVTKQATDQNFRNIESTLGTDNTKRLTFDINQVISPTLSLRAGGLLQGANIAGRDDVTDDRWGSFAAIKWTPLGNVTLTANYIHTNLEGIPDFGVPYYRPSTTAAGAPFPDVGVSRNNFYGFVNRDFQKATQDIGTINGEVRVNDALTVSNKFRLERSVLKYIGTIPESPLITARNPLLWTLSANPQSRYQVTDVIADQTEFKLKFDTGPTRHTAIGGVEISREQVSIDTYTGLASEASTGGFSGSGSLKGVNIFNPQYTDLPFPNFNPQLTGNPTVVPVVTKSIYLLDTANYQDVVIVNGGVRFDDYNVTASNNKGSQSVQSGLFNYNGGLVLKPLPISSFYVAYATSSNPVGSELDATGTAYGGLAPFIPGNPTQVFGPERNTATEVGTKWELFDRHLLATAALFQTNKDNARETATVNGVANTVIAGAAYQIRGLDLGVAGKITDEWSVSGGLVLMQSEVTASNVAPANPALYKTNVGLPLANIAHQSFNILTKYQLNPIFEIGGQATYLSEIYGGTLAANVGTVLPAHWRFDGFVEAKVNDVLTAKITANNLLNTTYYDSLYRSAAPFVLIAPGRSVSLVLTAKF